MVVVHDDDLARIHGISDDHESLQSDALVHVQKYKPNITQVPFGVQLPALRFLFLTPTCSRKKTGQVLKKIR